MGDIGAWCTRCGWRASLLGKEAFLLSIFLRPTTPQIDARRVVALEAPVGPWTVRSGPKRRGASPWVAMRVGLIHHHDSVPHEDSVIPQFSFTAVLACLCLGCQLFPQAPANDTIHANSHDDPWQAAWVARPQRRT